MMVNNQKLSSRLKIAFLGVTTAFKKERNFRIQFSIGVIVIILMIILGLNSIEKSILLLTVLVVLSLELINSQIEKILDLIQPNLHPKVKIIKDFSAGAVLISVVGSIIIGILIFLPYILNLMAKK